MKFTSKTNISNSSFSDSLDSDISYGIDFLIVKEKLKNLIAKEPEYESFIINNYTSVNHYAQILSNKDLFKATFFGDYKKKEINNLKLVFRLSPLTKFPIIFGWAVRKIANLGNNLELANWKYGAFHSSLALNKYIIEWDDSSLVTPHVDYENLSSFSYEIKDKFIWRAIKKIKNLLVNFANLFIYYLNPDWLLNDILDKELDSICEVCVKFNTDRFYSMHNHNCQFFVDKVLEELKYNLTFEGEMKREFEYFKENGKLDFKFEDYEFKTRRELDEFVDRYFYRLNNDEKKLLLLYKNTFEAKRLLKIDEKTKKFKNKADEEELGTTKEEEEMWKSFEYFENDL